MLPVEQKDRDVAILNMAREFLLKETPSEVDEAVIDSYLSVPPPCSETILMPELYQRLLESAQNANMRAGVIGGSIGGIKNLGNVLLDFDHIRVLEEYSEDPDRILEEIIQKLSPNGKVRKSRRSIWPKYCRTILSGAEFLSQFSESGDFFDWANHFYDDKRSIAALPMVIEAEIYGIGFPLACDFLKELGYVNYGKPDIHIKVIFKKTGLAPNKDNYQVLKAISRIAANAGVSSYEVDKVFWLIGSGKFYNHSHIGKGGRVGRMKKQFLKYLSDHPVSIKGRSSEKQRSL